MAAQHAHAQLVNGALAALSPPVSDAHLRTLALVVGPSMLTDALDLIDKHLVARITPPAGRPVYQVASSSPAGAGGDSYTLYPDLPGGGYCPCAFFSSSVLPANGTAVICKHLLACRIADRLDAWTDKRVGLKWVAGFATRFGAAVPAPATAATVNAAG
ncbi:hypothetical protein DMC30DRAFT_52452 [Rhodotorula diobovata]|uniref:SWIM-type domain-containing protein n=1 Tax=Rhodotorula diobovata TaxID=5288 RepID=A0A5C5FPB7_9BASI|nr:hypothetical protein DMC30DRAFT_52452 [Rhodotorula diobovata]